MEKYGMKVIAILLLLNRFNFFIEIKIAKIIINK